MPDQNRTIGEILKTAREKQGLSLEEISLLTKVNLKYLSAIEANNWDVLPSSVQQKGFVRTYARVLEVDPGPLLGQLRSIIQEDDLKVEPAPPDVPDSSPAAEQHPLEEIGSILKTQREHLGFTRPNVEDQIFIPQPNSTLWKKSD